MRPSLRDLAVGDPIDAALVRAATRRKLFGIDEPVRLGRLVVEERLGAGAIGVVYRARDPELGRTVAVKLLQSSDDDRRLIDEARALAGLRHPNVVGVHDVGAWEGRVFLTMEHVPGGTLRTWLAGEARGWRAIVTVLVAAARGLAAAHRGGLVHRDVKPDNVLVGDDGEVRIADFGLARAPRLDAEGAEPPAGTPAYLAPEVRAGQAADAASDQYGFAVMARDALAGDKAVPAHVRAAVTRALSDAPAARFPSMDALVAELARDPAAVRRRQAAVAAAACVALAGGIVGWLALRRDARGPSCAAAGGLDDVWSAARRADVTRALNAIQTPYAAASAASVAGAIDAYAAAWSRASIATCEDANVEKTLSPALVDLRTRCLARGRAALATTVGVLAGGGKDVASGALAMVEALPDLAACDDLDALAAPTPPANAATAGTLARLEADLAAAEALGNAARLDEALARTREVVAAARALGHRPFLAQALFAQATVERTLGDKDAAATTWQEALAEAQASSHDELVAMTAIKLATVRADSDVARAEELLRLAAATSERLGNPARLRVAHEAAYGKLLYRDGRYDDAVEHLQAAVAASAADGHGDTLAHAQLLTNLGGAFVGAGRDADGVAPLERALALREARLGAGHPDLADTLNTLGVVLGHVGRDADALGALERGGAILEALGTNRELQSMILDNQAGVLGRLGKPAEALAVMRRAAAIAEQTIPAGDVRLAGVYSNLAAIMQDLPATHAEAITLLDRALAILESAGQGGHPDAAIAILTRGVIRIQLGQRAEAIADCQKAAAIALPLVGAEHPIVLEAGLCQQRAREAAPKP